MSYRNLIVVGLAFVWVEACSSAPPPRPAPGSPPDAPTAATEGVEPGVDLARARQLLGQAVDAMNAGDRRKARELLDQADSCADDAVREEIRLVQDRIYNAEADEVAPEIVALAKQGQCQQAADRTLAAMRGRSGTPLVTFIQDRTAAATAECIRGVFASDLAAARLLVQSKDVRRALGATQVAELDKELAATVTQALLAKLREPLEERRWGELMTRLDQLVASGEAKPAERSQILVVVREGVHKDVLEAAKSALGRADGARTLERIDQLLAAGRWQTEAREPDRDPLPAELTKARDVLAFWVVCLGAGARESAPKKLWTHGKVALRAPLAAVTAQSDAIETLGHGAVVWAIAAGPLWTLVSKTDPGQPEGIPGRMAAAAGWVRSSDLRAEDTGTWIPPGDAIVGIRIWGPLRPTEKTLELGVVVAVDGADLRVQRDSDRETVSVARREIHYGTMAAGTKVLAHCAHPIKPEPALIDTVAGSGDAAVVKLTCLDIDGNPTALKRTLQLGALRTKPEWLPRRR